MFPNTDSLNILGSRLPTVPKRYFGKYRGKVADNIDPLFLGRIMAIVPAIADLPLTWAMPCVPYAGEQVGFYAIPDIGANVWIEFEGGDPDYPIWTGCFWEEGQVPLLAPPPTTKIFKTDTITLILNDIPEAGGLTLEIIPPAVDTPISITMNSAGIQINTEAVFDLNSQESNLTSESLTIEAEEVNVASTAVTIEADETNLSGASFTVETDETNIASAEVSIESADTNLAGAALTIEAVETNILGEALTVESGETNIASLVIAMEGVPVIDGMIPLLIPV